MRRSVCCALAVLAAVSACKREPSFDERYAGAQKAIRQKATELDQEMAKRATEAQALDPEPSEAATSPTPGAI